MRCGRRRLIGVGVSLFCASLAGASFSQEAEPAWAASVRRIHGRFTGQSGTLAQFGDSITVTQAFWSPLRYQRRNASPALEQAFRGVSAWIRPECWGEWKGPAYGSEGGQTIRWADDQAAEWLKKLNPEAAVIMFGTNDLSQLELPEYREKLRALAQRCAERGTIPILTTIPPRHGFEPKSKQFAQAAREVAAQLSLPLVDYQAEILRRRAEDWDGALERFQGFDTYEVPTLISRDGVHPSYPKQFQDDYSEAGLRSSGYTLRNYLTLVRVSEVVAVLKRPAPKP